MARREYPDPGPKPVNATPKEMEAWRRANEMFAAEGFQKLPTEKPKIDATDDRLKQLKRDHLKFLEKNNPFTDALWLALLRDASSVLYDSEMTRRYMQSIATGERRPGVVDAPHRPSIVVLAEQLVAQGLRGDAAAIEKIAERVEGKTGLRRDDIDPEDPKRQRQSREIVEGVVRAMTEARQATAIDVTASPVESKLAIPAPESEETK
jgi:hypothetical protein